MTSCGADRVVDYTQLDLPALSATTDVEDLATFLHNLKTIIHSRGFCYFLATFLHNLALRDDGRRGSWLKTSTRIYKSSSVTDRIEYG